MTNILQTTFFNAYSWMKIIALSLKVCTCMGTQLTMSAMIQVMALHQTGSKPLSEPMLLYGIMRPQRVNWNKAYDTLNKNDSCAPFY